MEAARQLAHALHSANITLVYGGGTKGLMGELARTLVSLSGPQTVHGIIPKALIQTEKAYDGATKAVNGDAGKEAERGMSQAEMEQLQKDQGKNVDVGVMIKESEYGQTTVVADMHTRKRLMAQEVKEGGPGSGFVAMAGGYGTFEEVMEMVTWNQLGIHHVGIVLLNVNGYWDGLMDWVRTSVENGFVGENNRGILQECKSVEGVLPALRNYRLTEGRYNLDWSQR